MRNATFKLHDVVKRNDNGRHVSIVEVKPVGLRVFYRTEDMATGHTAIFDERQLRPVFEPAPLEDATEFGGIIKKLV